MPRHRHQEFLRFLKAIYRNSAKHLDLHLIVDNYATHKHPKVKAGWLAISASISTSSRPPPPGTIKSSASSASLPRTPFAAVSSAALPT
jgi:hypothetical protein